jgi:hypothetical protein
LAEDLAARSLAHRAGERGDIGGGLASVLDDSGSPVGDGIENRRSFTLQISEPHPVSQDVKDKCDKAQNKKDQK